MKKLASATDPLWYKDAIIYELHVRAFADSNSDGIGISRVCFRVWTICRTWGHLHLASAFFSVATAR